MIFNAALNKNYKSLAGKTRIESLNERIEKANNLINSFVEKTEKKENFYITSLNEENLEHKINKSIQVEENNFLENNNNTSENNNNVEKGENIQNNLKENENKENINEVNNMENNNEENNQNKINDNIEKNQEENNSNINNDIVKNNNENKADENNINNNENKNIENYNNENNININKNNENEKINNKDSQIGEKMQTEQTKNINEKKPVTEIEIDIPFIKKTKLLLLELKKLKEKSEIKEETINQEISELQNRSLLQISLSDMKSKKENEILKKELKKKDDYIKNLEKDIFKIRNENINLKKSENENLLKISALQDELRVFKNKFMQYRTQTENNSYGYQYGEKLVQSNWIRDNMIKKEEENYRKNKNLINSTNNINKFRNDNRNSFYENKWNSPWNSQSYHNINRNRIDISNEINNNEKYIIENRRIKDYKNNYNNGGNSNFQRVSNMILENNKFNKNYGNDFNRYNRYENNNYTNNNN